MRNTESRIADALHEKTAYATQMAVNEAAMSPDRGGSTPGWLYISGMAALGPMLTGSALVGSRPDLTEEEIRERGQLELQKLITPERVMFCAIYAALLMDNYVPETGNLTTSTGLEKIVDAMRIWKMVYPSKRPEDYFDPQIVKAVQSAEGTASVAFNDLMQRVHAMGGNHSVN